MYGPVCVVSEELHISQRAAAPLAGKQVKHRAGGEVLDTKNGQEQAVLGTGAVGFFRFSTSGVPLAPTVPNHQTLSLPL